MTTPADIYRFHVDRRFPLTGLAAQNHRLAAGHAAIRQFFWESICEACSWRAEGFIESGDPFNPNTDSGRFGAKVSS